MSTRPAGPTLTVCRGCCCGTASKHPGVDHRAQLERFRAAGRVRVSDCLDACAYSNVVVVSPSPAGRAAGARPVWLLGVLDAETEDELAAWVRAGGPGVAEPPGMLDLRIFTPSRRVRAAVD
jgi:hypothetical protein